MIKVEHSLHASFSCANHVIDMALIYINTLFCFHTNKGYVNSIQYSFQFYMEFELQYPYITRT
jgi:hypothetical protein